MQRQSASKEAWGPVATEPEPDTAGKSWGPSCLWAGASPSLLLLHFETLTHHLP